MFMPKAHRFAIYKSLFTEGVLVTRKDRKVMEHSELKNIPNLHIIKTVKSLKSRNFVTELFVWGYYYWYLTNEGIDYLRIYLNLSSESLPMTLHQQRAVRSALPLPEKPKHRGENHVYRRIKDTDTGYKSHVDRDKMEFRGGFGRGKDF
ncbi:40S ribosomal protein S10-like [Anopheles nili]|uniref:40S ribosomal protein S10-like n=1 Tax=Anopheles nili TaxID=185578 RepID=UPI00237B85DF|nr:40S ribosomal protein S10-like [Anopheles nili]